MDFRKKTNNKLHCHFFHITGNCKKADKCPFLHGKKLNGCPNGDKCPIQILHIPIEENKFITPMKQQSPQTDQKSHDNSSDTKSSSPEQQSSDKKQNKQITVPKELEDEEVKHNVQVQPPKDVVINKQLPMNIQDLIKSHYNQCQESANFISNFYQLSQDMKQFLPIYQSILPRMELDLMFIMDCTGSMSGWIQAVKDEILSIIAAIKDVNKGNTSIRISFIGYRDYGSIQRFSIFDFSSEIDSFQNFLGSVQAEGGNDAQEDVAGGFKHANLQQWKSQAKYAVFIADCPAHGKEYSDAHGDRYPDGDPDGIDLKQEFKNLIKKGVKLYSIQITQQTKQMFELFKQYNKEVNGQDLEILDLGYSTQWFGKMVTQTATQTLSMSYTRQNKENPESAFYKAFKICQAQDTQQKDSFFKRFNIKEANESEESDEEETKSDVEVINLKTYPQKQFPEAIFSQNFEATCHSYFIVQDVGVPINWKKPLVQHSEIKTKLQISRIPFAEGAMRYAFYAKDTMLNQKLVVKLNKKQHKSDPTLNKADMIKDLESQFICQHIVNQFNDRVSEHVTSTENLKNFVHCYIYEFTDPAHPFKFYQAENYIPGEYVKFNNNSGWCDLKFDEPGLLSQALSHFSYQVTEGYLMIVDLQGVGGLLTDPQIHCLDQNRFGFGNLGYCGFFKFFMTHQCNKFCKQLQLVYPQIKEIPTDMKFFKYEIVKPDNPNKKVCTICDVCKKGFKINAGFLYERRIQCREKYCPACNSMRVSTLKTDSCKQCNGPFCYSVYWTLMKRTQASELCINCRKLERDKMREQLEKQ
ncbi:hypothetical protein ABPG72_010084 [Tetrahymena utriculariae]